VIDAPPWLSQLIAVLRSSQTVSELPSFEVAFVVSGTTSGLAAPPARLTDGSHATAWIEGSRTTMEQIVSGVLSPQKAFVTDLLSFRGDPEILLQVTTLFELCSRTHNQ